MANVLEIIMLICFGFSWPINFIKAYKSGSTKGVSLIFFCLIEAGYVCGIAAKILAGNVSYVLVFYVLNLLTVAANILLYFINQRKERGEVGWS